ncbi:hypothetical protein PAXRUDRAFT_836064 [Paxillus rubicundulus Ve08.2h10]|uniref:Unplaced genomic scaffold scaffold_4298, whole genome shotgun sequence n=1 Tax=Paxillus rubicundulus Ve08.2h10 TaxID=930991 RepID=A0A0D0CT16_9AGAM|nr:hypothetical protein PAXRUDRAFT_836064 [Paxillus rubicundulus Ve08.2h10]
MLVHVTVCINSVATSPPFVLRPSTSVTTPACPSSSPGATALLPHTSQVGYNRFIES